MEKDGKPNVNRLVKPFEMRLFDLRKQAYTIQMTSSEQNQMAEFEVRYKRNRSLFASGSAPQLTIMGTNKYNPDVKYVPPPG